MINFTELDNNGLIELVDYSIEDVIMNMKS